MSTDGGFNWISLFVGMGPPWIDQPIVEIDPVDLNAVYITVNYHKLYRSTDHGNNWDSIPPPSGYSFSSLAIAPCNNNSLYISCASPNQVFKSTDRGQTWTLLPFPQVGGSLNCMTIHPEDADIVYASVFSYGGLQGGVYKTTNGGVNWEEKNNGLTNEDWDINTININSQNPDELYIGTGSAETDFLFKTTNGGDNWFKFSKGLPDSGGVSSIAIDTLTDRIYLGVGAFSGSGIYIYDSLSSVQSEPEVPAKFRLYQNYPNPFNPVTTIRFVLSQSGNVSLKVYDVLGREIETLVDDFRNAGNYEIDFNASEFPSGVYFYKLQTENYIDTKKMIFLK
jgi:photosystem II stability/assembly factor-like uncharacterized protein